VETHVPFVAHIRVVPNLSTGKRWSLYRNLEKVSLRVEDDLLAAGLNIATPIAFTPQLGDFGARLTVVGFVEKSRLAPTAGDDRKVEAPTTNIDLIHSGTDPDEKTALIDGNRGGSLSEAQDPTAVVEAEVTELRALLDSASTQFQLHDVVHLEYNGVKYGLKKQGGRSFKV
jgi:hypothetical protein